MKNTELHSKIWVHRKENKHQKNIFFKNFKYFITARKNKHFLQCFGVVGNFSITSHFQGTWHCYHHVRWVVLPIRSQCLAHSRWSINGNGGY